VQEVRGMNEDIITPVPPQMGLRTHAGRLGTAPYMDIGWTKAETT